MIQKGNRGGKAQHEPQMKCDGELQKQIDKLLIC
jgi:hypothetical protein